MNQNKNEQNQNNLPRIAFFGTPELTTTLLDTLTEAGMTPVVVVTGEDKPIGRKQIITPTPAKVWALEHTIPVLQPPKLDVDFLQTFKDLNIDLSVVVAYGKIMPEELINAPRLGTINLHYSLLPKYRGASPVETAILEGETVTGIAIQHMRHKLDSGPIINSLAVLILPDETAPELRTRLNDLARPILIDAIQKLIDTTATFTEQNHEQATFSKKISKEDGLVDLTLDPVRNYQKYRAYFGWPGTYFFIERDGKQMRVIIKDAEFTDNQFIIKKVLPEGRTLMDFEVFQKSLK